MISELAVTLLNNIPNFAGFILLAFVLYRLVERLMDYITKRLDNLESRIEALSIKLDDHVRQVNSSAVMRRKP